MEILKVAEQEIGYIERPGNKTKYGAWFGLDGVAWCAIFISWVYSMAGNQLPMIGWVKGFAGCQYGFEYFKKKGWITLEPSPGDIVLFDFDGNQRYEHAGLFVDWITKSKTFKTIEGNTSSVNQTNGGMVMPRNRKNKNVIFVKIPR